MKLKEKKWIWENDIILILFFFFPLIRTLPNTYVILRFSVFVVKAFINIEIGLSLLHNLELVEIDFK